MPQWLHCVRTYITNKAMHAEQTPPTTLEQLPPQPYGELVSQNDCATVDRVLRGQNLHIDSLWWKIMPTEPGKEGVACAVVPNEDREHPDYIVLVTKAAQQNSRLLWPEVKRDINLHAYTRAEWIAFIAGIKDGQLVPDDLDAPPQEQRSTVTTVSPADEAHGYEHLPRVIVDDEGMLRLESSQTAKRRREVALEVARLGLPPVIEGYVESEVFEPSTPLVAEVSPSAQNPLRHRAAALALPSAQG